METTNSILQLINIASQILSELQLLTSATKATALVRFQSDFLVTDQQQRIYMSIDGEKDSKAISFETGASLRAVQLLIKSLSEADLIEIERRGNTNIPRKSTAKIATYYAKLDLNNCGGAAND